jgi:hypothetical protein
VSENIEAGLTPAAMLAETARVLAIAGYTVDRQTDSKLGLPPERALLAEDKYGVVTTIVFDTWSELVESWVNAQAVVIEAVSRFYTRLDRKAWDGYLVLLTPAFPGEDETSAHEIRYNTSRIRKLVGTGDDLRSVSDISRVLAPLLPLSVDTVEIAHSQSLLDELPERLEQGGISRELAELAVDAFKTHRPIVEEIHRYLETH